MTTTAPEAGTVDLAGANGSAPKRRGRPPGSKNKPKAEKATAPKKRGRPRKTAAAAPAVKTVTRGRPRKTTTAAAVEPTGSIHAIVVEDDGVLVITASGATKMRSSVVVDRRTK